MSCHHLQAWAGAYCGGLPPTACYFLELHLYAQLSLNTYMLPLQILNGSHGVLDLVGQSLFTSLAGLLPTGRCNIYKV